MSKSKGKQWKTIFVSILLLGAFLAIIKYSGLDIVFDKFVFQIKYEELVNKYSIEYNLDKYLIFAIIRSESGFDKYAISNKDAKGLMQITDSTGKWISEQIGMKDFVSDNLFLPEVNINMGCWYFSYLINHFKNTDLAIAAYNAGMGNVDEWLKNEKYSADGINLTKIPYSETEKYVKKVKYSYNKFQELYR